MASFSGLSGVKSPFPVPFCQQHGILFNRLIKRNDTATKTDGMTFPVMPSFCPFYSASDGRSPAGALTAYTGPAAVSGADR